MKDKPDSYFLAEWFSEAAARRPLHLSGQRRGAD